MRSTQFQEAEGESGDIVHHPETMETSEPSIHIALPWKWRPFKRHKPPGCQLFADGDEVLHLARKLVPIETSDEGEEEPRKQEVLPCGVFGCTQSFSSLLSYENHYNSMHRHVCSACHRTFPSAFLLDVHLQEQHDSLFTIMAAKQNMYRCLVEQCQEKFAGPGQRHQHLVKQHKYPPNFRFHRNTKTRPRKQQTERENQMEVDGAGKHPATTLTSSSGNNTSPPVTFTDRSRRPPSGMSDNKENVVTMVTDEACRKSGDDVKNVEVETSGAGAKHVGHDKPQRTFAYKVPDNFCFGHGVARGFQRPAGKKRQRHKGGHWHQQTKPDAPRTETDIANVDMTDMASALDDV